MKFLKKFNDIVNYNNFVSKQDFVGKKQSNISLIKNIKQLYYNKLFKFIDPEVLNIFVNAGLTNGKTDSMSLSDFENITSINTIKNLFKDNQNIYDLTCLQYITKIENKSDGRIFQGLSNLEKIYIPNFVNQLDNGSTNNIFTNNTHLKYIYGCNNVTIFGQSLFKNCINLELSELPDSLITLSGEVFQNCKKITINDSKNATYIGASAFKECNSITSFIIRNKITEIGGSAFYGCTNLKSVIFEDGGINNLKFNSEGGWSGGIFRNTQITTIELPERLTSIGNANLYGLSNIIFKGNIPPTISGFNSAFGSGNSTAYVYVPDTALSDYQTAWNYTGDHLLPVSQYVAN